MKNIQLLFFCFTFAVSLYYVFAEDKATNILSHGKKGGDSQNNVPNDNNGGEGGSNNEIQDQLLDLFKMGLGNEAPESGMDFASYDEMKTDDLLKYLKHDYVRSMMNFTAYLQDVLNSKNESKEKKMVKKFLRKSMQDIKENEKSDQKKTIEEILSNVEGHNEMLNKFAEVLKIDKEFLENENTRKTLDDMLVGILKFIEYTNNSETMEALLDDLSIEEVNEENGESKLKVNIQNTEAHLDMLKKASSFMGFKLTDEHIKNMTIHNKWYSEFLNTILNYTSNDDEL